MHIPDGYVGMGVNVAAAALSLVVVTVAVRRAGRSLDEKKIPLLGVTGAFVFAAQLINFPIAGGTSGHFLGALLTAVLLGPLNACLVMALVLTIQCLLFADGGLTALGANIFNMGLVAGLGGYAIFALLRWVLPRTRGGFFGAVAVAAWGSVVLSATACAVELSLPGFTPLDKGFIPVSLRLVLPAMAGVHALIGLGEALITGVVLSAIAATRPDLLDRFPVTSAPANPQEVNG